MGIDNNVQVLWRPSAAKANIEKRAALYRVIREFFAARRVLEVETPLLCQHTVTDCHINSFSVPYKVNEHVKNTYYLQTSPEYAMKRLLAAGSGPIFQIGKAFRQGESGKRHNPEFTMLEWYRPGFDHHQLMCEVDALLQLTLSVGPALKISYRELFQNRLEIDPHTASISELKTLLTELGILTQADSNLLQNLSFDDCLQLLLSEHIEPLLGQVEPCMVFDFPPSQAALSRIRCGHPPVAERFEVYFKGIELANGFHELADPVEQQARFKKEQKSRQARGLFVPLIDPYLIAALNDGLPHCSGVALGIDRLLMLSVDAKCLSEVLAFPWNSA